MITTPPPQASFGELEVEVYSDEFVRELKKESDVAMEQIAAGKLKPITSVKDYARKYGCFGSIKEIE
jgi:hypothetical protein